ncbi:MAG: hypothetical protein M3N26_09305 [Pseudomonadota bacterium]|nr:hypothetical protein [Pseudomonadota bacterium]
MTKRRLPPLLALAAAAGFGTLLVAELGTPSDVAALRMDTPGQAEPGTEKHAPLQVAHAGAEATREIVDRPLFFTSRRPLPPERPEVAVAKPEPPPVLDFILVGTVLTDRSKIALIKPDKSGPLQLTPGESVGRWTVTSIDPDRIMVRSGAVEQMVGVRDFVSAAHVLPAAMRSSSVQQAQTAAPKIDIQTVSATLPQNAPAPPPVNSPSRRAGTRR